MEKKVNFWAQPTYSFGGSTKLTDKTQISTAISIVETAQFTQLIKTETGLTAGEQQGMRVELA